MQDYCWNSLASLYTFWEIYVPPSLARDCSVSRNVPRIHPIFLNLDYSKWPQRIQGCALPMSYPGNKHTLHEFLNSFNISNDPMKQRCIGNHYLYNTIW